MRMATCHSDRKHYCRGLCNACYNVANKQRAKERGPLVPACHPDRPYAKRGMCFPCYSVLRASPDYALVRTKGRARCINHPDRPADGRKLCVACYTAWRRKQDPERDARDRRKDRAAVYGLSLEAYEQLKTQANCSLCSKHLPTPPDRHIDHCHETGRVRGVLCFTCNKSLGMLGDSEAGLLRALAYVRGEHIQRFMAEKGVYIPDPNEEAEEAA